MWQSASIPVLFFPRASCLTQRHFATVYISPTCVLFNNPSVDRRRSNPQAQDRATERQREVLTNSQSQNKAAKQLYKSLKVFTLRVDILISSMNWCNLNFQDPDSHYLRNRRRRIADRNKAKQQIQLLQQNIAATS